MSFNTLTHTKLRCVIMFGFPRAALRRSAPLCAALRPSARPDPPRRSFRVRPLRTCELGRVLNLSCASYSSAVHNLYRATSRLRALSAAIRPQGKKATPPHNAPPHLFFFPPYFYGDAAACAAPRFGARPKTLPRPDEKLLNFGNKKKK